MKRYKRMARAVENPLENGINRIVEGTRFKGEIECESNIRIDGTFEGELTTKGRLVVGPQGSLKGTVVCQNCEVEGALSGKLAVEELLSLKSTATVDGEIHYGKLSIEPGAALTGTCFMGSKIKDIKSGGFREGQKSEEKSA
jgi:cytoskeletal protein CcmA (bactofilin family)